MQKIKETTTRRQIDRENRHSKVVGRESGLCPEISFEDSPGGINLGICLKNKRLYLTSHCYMPETEEVIYVDNGKRVDRKQVRIK